MISLIEYPTDLCVCGCSLCNLYDASMCVQFSAKKYI